MADDPILNCLQEAGRHNGRVFGSYVRDVIVRRELEPSAPIESRPIDLWFDDELKLVQFRAAMGSTLELQPGPGTSHFRPFNSQNFTLHHVGLPIATVTITLSDRLPVNDFDISFLTYQFLGSTHITESHSSNSALFLIGQINQRKCRLLYEFAQSLKYGTVPYRTYHDARIYQNYTLQGWRIGVQVPEIELQINSATSPSQALEPIFKMVNNL